ncbi:MAG: cytochrome c, partial [Anaerolineae bacterium]|nr:cytochrome c [Anaerolineae bacterium]
MNMDTKVVLGTIFFFGMLVLVGWVFINEEGRMAEFTVQYEARSIERGGALFESHCATCHGTQGLGSGRAPGLQNPRLFNGERLDEMNWTGSLPDYIENAVAAGRPNSGAFWPEAMPTWSQEFGGPLRTDQVNDLVSFVMNWEMSALDEENPPQVVQDFVLPADPAVAAAGAEGAVEPLSSGEPVGIDVQFVDLPAGDAVRGEQLYTTLACASCHEAGLIAPLTAGTVTRVTERIATES